jgi:hypothetical protein
VSGLDLGDPDRDEDEGLVDAETSGSLSDEVCVVRVS